MNSQLTAGLIAQMDVPLSAIGAEIDDILLLIETNKDESYSLSRQRKHKLAYDKTHERRELIAQLKAKKKEKNNLIKEKADLIQKRMAEKIAEREEHDRNRDEDYGRYLRDQKRLKDEALANDLGL